MYNPNEVPSDQPLILLKRDIAASAERIFRAFGDAATIGTWWGPTGFRTTTERLDFRVGGDWLHTMHGPDGTDYPNYSVYRVIEPNARIVYDHGTAPGEPFLFRAEIRLTALAPERTRLTLETRFNDIATRDLIALKYGAVEGGRQHLMRLDSFLSGARKMAYRVEGRDLIFSRWFEAPCGRVFAAWTDARSMARWWGPHGFSVSETVSEPHAGGHYRVVVQAPDGTAYPMDGRYVDVVAAVSVVLAVSVAEHPASWHAIIAEAIRAAGGDAEARVGAIEMQVGFCDDGDGTRVDLVMRLATAAQARAFDAVGAPAGWGMSFERLDALLLDVD